MSTTKDKICNAIIVAGLIALVTGAGLREFAIFNGKLTSDLNANQHSITNLPDGFFPEETDPTVADWAKKPNPAPVTDLTPAINYTDSATNAVITNLTARLGAKVSTNDFVLATNNLASSVSGLQSSKADRSEIPGNYPAVSNKAMTAVQVEADPNVPSWAKQPKMPLAEEIRKGTNAITATGMKIYEGEIYGPGIGYWLAVEHGLTNYLEWTEDENAWRRNGSQYPQIKFNRAEIMFYESAQYWHQFRANPWEGWHSFTGWGVCYVKGRSVVTNELLTAEKDPTVPEWAKQPEPPEAMPGNGVILTNGALQTKGGTAITAGNVGAATPGEVQTAISSSGHQTAEQVQTAIENAGHATTAELEHIADAANNALVYASGTYQYMHGNTNAWFEGTNYNVNAEQAAQKTKFAFEDGMDLLTMPCSMTLREIREGQKQVVWDQRDWTVWYWNFKSGQMRTDLQAQITGLSENVRTNYMTRGWAKYTAVQGLDNPATDTLWIDTPKVSLMAGKQWEKLIEVGGAGYYTLTGNGIELAPQDAESTFLTIKDFEGNACLTFRKTSSYLVYCECGTDITRNFHDAQGRVVFHLTTDVQPTAEFSTILDTASFIEQGEEGCPANYEWTGSAGNWDCHFLLKPGISSDACFARFKVMREGENVVEHTVPIKINGGIAFDQDGVTRKIRPTISGNTVNWVVVQ